MSLSGGKSTIFLVFDLLCASDLTAFLLAVCLAVLFIQDGRASCPFLQRYLSPKSSVWTCSSQATLDLLTTISASHLSRALRSSLSAISNFVFHFFYDATTMSDKKSNILLCNSLTASYTPWQYDLNLLSFFILLRNSEIFSGLTRPNSRIASR